MVMIFKLCSRANAKQASREAMDPVGEAGSTSSQSRPAGGRPAANARSVEKGERGQVKRAKAQAWEGQNEV